MSVSESSAVATSFLIDRRSSCLPFMVRDAQRKILGLHCRTNSKGWYLVQCLHFKNIYIPERSPRLLHWERSWFDQRGKVVRLRRLSSRQFRGRNQEERTSSWRGEKKLFWKSCICPLAPHGPHVSLSDSIRSTVLKNGSREDYRDVVTLRNCISI